MEGGGTVLEKDGKGHLTPPRLTEGGTKYLALTSTSSIPNRPQFSSGPGVENTPLNKTPDSVGPVQYTRSPYFTSSPQTPVGYSLVSGDPRTHPRSLSPSTVSARDGSLPSTHSSTFPFSSDLSLSLSSPLETSLSVHGYLFDRVPRHPATHLVPGGV